MSSQIKFENHSLPEENSVKPKVKLTDLLSRLNEEKKQEIFKALQTFIEKKKPIKFQLSVTPIKL